MNRNIEVINENLYAVNMQYLKEGYIEELKLVTNTEIGQINLSNTGKIILDSGSRAYPALKKMFLIYMQKPTDELMEIMNMPKSDSLDGLCENVIGWELKRRITEIEYKTSQPVTPLIKKIKVKLQIKFLRWIRKKVIIWHQSKRE